MHVSHTYNNYVIIKSAPGHPDTIVMFCGSLLQIADCTENLHMLPSICMSNSVQAKVEWFVIVEQLLQFEALM